MSKYIKTRNYLRSIGWSNKVINLILKRYANHLNYPHEDKNNWNDWIESFCKDKVQDGNWKAFLEFYGSIKNEYASKRIKRVGNKTQSYDDWWNQSNLDGSFAYNGVTDDF